MDARSSFAGEYLDCFKWVPNAVVFFSQYFSFSFLYVVIRRAVENKLEVSMCNGTQSLCSQRRTTIKLTVSFDRCWTRRKKNEEPASRCSVEKRKNKVLSARKCDLVKCRYGYSVSCLQCHFTELHRLEILSCYGEGDCLLVLLCIDSFADDSDALCCLENVPYRGDRVL